MNYLNTLPKVLYKLDQNHNLKIIPDITLRAKFRDVVKTRGVLFYNYTIKDETIEVLADKIYDNPDLYWIISFANDIVDLFNDWPILDDLVFRKYLKKKYQVNDTFILEKKNWTLQELEADPLRVHSYYVFDELTQKEYEIDFSNYKNYFNDPGPETGYYKTYYEYEEEQNDKKRNIKIPKVEYIPGIIRELEDLFND